jgi:hypothetical protein
LDPQATISLKIECYAYNEVRIHQDTKSGNEKEEKEYFETDSTDILELQPGIIYEINNAEDATGYIPCQQYDLLIYSPTTGIKHLKFQVDLMNDYGNKERSITEEGFKKLVTALNDFVDNLAIDAFNKGKHIGKESISSKKDIYHLNEYLAQTQPMLNMHIRQIQTNLKTTMVSCYERKFEKKKQNSKTMRLNRRIDVSSGKHYSVYKTPSFNTIENRLLKKYILNTKRRLSLIVSETFKQIYNREEQMQHNLLSQNSIRNNLTNCDRIASRSYKISLNNQLKSLVSQYNSFHAQVSFLKEFINRAEQNLNSFNKLLLLPSFKEIKPENFGLPTLTFQKDFDYYFFKKFSDEIFSGSTSFKFEEKEYALKRTIKLFELYVFLLIDKALVKSGLQCTSSSVRNFYDFAENQVIFEYQNHNQLVKVYYGYECLPYRECNECEKFVSVNSRHVSPDYLIEVFDVATKELKKAFIIDAKYRPLRNIYTTNGRTEIQDTADDYLQMAYINKDQFLERARINDVILIYPDLDEKSLSDSFSHIHFLGNNPEKGLDHSHCIDKICEVLNL